MAVRIERRRVSGTFTLDGEYSTAQGRGQGAETY